MAAENELKGIQVRQPVDLTKRMLELSEAWNKLNGGTITPAQFTQVLDNLRTDYLAIIDRPKEPSEELLWKQYELHTDLYKHYLELILKFNAFYYAVTGAIISFYFTKSDIPLIKYALLFPILMSVVFGVLFGFAVLLNHITRLDIFNLSRSYLKNHSDRNRSASSLNILKRAPAASYF
ncbi:MAG: hypothetical protein ACJ74W_24770 [Pyrinomonadaceae bacterium]